MAEVSYTYSILDISEAAYAEIRAKLDAAGYGHAFHFHEDEVIDMHGIAIRCEEVVSEMAHGKGKGGGGKKSGGMKGGY